MLGIAMTQTNYEKLIAAIGKAMLIEAVNKAKVAQFIADLNESSGYDSAAIEVAYFHAIHLANLEVSK